VIEDPVYHTFGVRWKTFSCCWAGNAAYNGHTSNRGTFSVILFSILCMDRTADSISS